MKDAAPVDEGEFLSILTDGARQHGIPFTEAQAGLCFEHVALMLEWNRRMNLTRITDLRQIIEKHLLDSLIPARWLPLAGPALDIGSGSGFPGVPLKILASELDMTLLDAQRKRISFLRVVLAKLALPQMRVLQGRWEEFLGVSAPPLPARFNLITTRAIRLQPEQITHIVENRLRPGGVLACWAGPGKADFPVHESESQSQGKAVSGERCHSYTLPSVAGVRRIMLWRKPA
jgi:16S rRNA (guanine527-N7)-methyltransferase